MIRGSLLLDGPRRIGKTELLKSLAAGNERKLSVVRVDVEGSTTENEGFVLIRDAIRSHLGSVPGMMDRIRTASVTFGGAGMGLGVDSVSVSLDRELHDLLLEWQKSLPLAHLAVLALDEVPWWLEGSEKDAPGTARRILATLRRLRQADDLPRVRQVLTGSLSLRTLAARLDALAEINDLDTITLAPLILDDALRLVHSELGGKGATADVSREIVRQAGGIPWWVKLLTGRARAFAHEVNDVGPTHVAQAIGGLLQDRTLFALEARGPRGQSVAQGSARQALLEATGQTLEGIARHAARAVAMNSLGGERAAADEVIDELIAAYILNETEGGLRFANPLFAAWIRAWPQS